MKKILVSGFAPFGGEKINPSWEAVKGLPDMVGEARIVRIELPVVFGRAAELLLERIGEENPDAVISVGQAGGRDAVTPELIAVNCRDARIPDNDGVQPHGGRIVEDGPDGLFTGLPVREMVEALSAAGLPARLSYSAGAYVCNDLFYLTRYALKERAVPSGFIHVPYETGQISDKPGQPGMPLAEMTAALEICIKTLLQEIEKEVCEKP